MYIALEMPLPIIFSGTWSIITLLCMITTVIVSTVLGVAMLVTALSGGFSPPKTAEELPLMEGSLTKAYHDAALEIAAERAGLSPSGANPFANAAAPDEPEKEVEPINAQTTETETQAKKTAIKKRVLLFAKNFYTAQRSTGFWNMLAAFIAFIPSLMFWNWVDSPSGYSVPFTTGAALNLVVLLLQFIFIGMYARKRRKNR